METVKHVLIIDDDEISRLVNRSVIESLTEFQIVSSEACNSFDAIELIIDQYSKYKTLPDLILLDIQMPIMHAFDFMDHIQRLRFLKLIPIIIVTTSSDLGDKAKCSELGVKYFFTKPVDTPLLKDAIVEILSIRL